jgi:hypothetical protein
MRIPGRLRRTWKRALGGSIVAFFLMLDLIGNGLLGGSFDETISSRAGRMRREGSVVAATLCYVLDAIDGGHCDDAADNQGS